MTRLVPLRDADADLDWIRSLLEREGLPTRDLGEKADRFFVGVADEEAVGVGAVEVHGDSGLLRSVAVAEAHRGEGVGTSICAGLEARAAETGVEELYLLTTTASDFFDALGYGEVPRESAPSAIRETTEFAELCPDSAVCMRKVIE
ncbi:arsenic resistance N-acetyltransferase ArsN2 (plasmid) [Halorussus salilacus]|uniref:arsenic resistance N-acetyltransferase ArsN2 n=1 Tax=Halorussus salilacus TaxID=2953750 RepID=UPI00209DA037|nr:arsenic resistance N-acetyltransferase ArsN2 [Halorussus salilacus]USZ69898.1 arsenic resistance N-acetyltransferase ArsN2 [Halorussus salilacus]